MAAKFLQFNSIAPGTVGLVLALCYSLSGASTLTFPLEGGNQLPPLTFPKYITVPANAPFGHVLAQATLQPGLGTDGGNCIVSQTTSVNGEPAMSASNTYQTNLPGIGVRFYITESWNGTWERAPTVSQIRLGSAEATEHYVRADLVVIGPVAPGTLTALPSLTVAFSGTCITPIVKTQYIKSGSRIQ